MPKKTLALVRRSPSVVIASIERRIYLIRGQKVMLDVDLADLYHVPTKGFNQAVKRNLARFPKDFMFRLSTAEMKNLRSQIVTSSWGGRRTMPYAFTEQGVAMLSSVLKSSRAVQVNIAIMRAFVRLRKMIAAHEELADKIKELEEKFQQHDQHFDSVFQALRELLEPKEVPLRRQIGFPVNQGHQRMRGLGPRRH